VNGKRREDHFVGTFGPEGGGAEKGLS